MKALDTEKRIYVTFWKRETNKNKLSENKIHDQKF